MVDQLEQLTMTVGHTDEPLHRHSVVEVPDEGDDRLDRIDVAVDAELVHRTREGVDEHRVPLAIDTCEPLTHLGAVPGHGLELEPDLRVARGQIGLEVLAHRGPPLVDERTWRLVHRPLAIDQPPREALEHLEEELLHRSEVVVDAAAVGARLRSEPPGADPGVADLDQQPFGCVEEGLGDLRLRSCDRLRSPILNVRLERSYWAVDQSSRSVSRGPDT